MKNQARSSEKQSQSRIKNMAYCAAGAALLTLCAWITIPLPGSVPITMQTFGVGMVLSLLGAKLGTVSILLYLYIGAVGIPVFSSFGSGFAVLLGATGGYLWGFLLMALVFWFLQALHVDFARKSRLYRCLSLQVGMLICYATGTAQFYFVYTQSGKALSVFTVILTCVLPYAFLDFLKLFLAVFCADRVRKWLPL